MPAIEQDFLLQEDGGALLQEDGVSKLALEYDVYVGALNLEYDLDVVVVGFLNLEYVVEVDRIGSINFEYVINVARIGALNLEYNLARSIEPKIDFNEVYGLRLGKDFNEVWGSIASIEFLEVYGHIFGIEFNEPYQINVFVAQDFNEPWALSATDNPAKEFNEPWSNTVEAEFNEPYALNARIAIDFVEAILYTTFVQNDFNEPYALSLRDPVRSQFKEPYALIESAIINVTGNPTITIGGEVIQVSDADLSTDDGTFVWQANISILDINQFRLFTISSEFTLDLYGEVYNLLTESRDLRRQDANVSLQILGVSPAAKHAFPRATPFTKIWDSPVMAKDAAEEALGGESIDWQVLNWEIPANRLGIAEGAPIRVVEQIAEAIGGLVESKADGSLLVRYKFPVSVTDFDNASPDHILVDTADNFSISERFQINKLYDKFKISDQISGVRDVLEFDFNEITDESGETTRSTTQGVLKAFPSPFRTNLTVRHTQDSSVGIQLVGVVEEEISELIEVRDGVGNLSRPIESLTSLVWEAEDLSGITFAVGDKQFASVHATLKYSLVQVTYQTKYISYDITGIPDINVQFILEDSGVPL